MYRLIIAEDGRVILDALEGMKLFKLFAAKWNWKMKKADITIIGAGVVGLAIAAELARPDWSVFILEKNPVHGGGISSRNSESMPEFIDDDSRCSSVQSAPSSWLAAPAHPQWMSYIETYPF